MLAVLISMTFLSGFVIGVLTVGVVFAHLVLKDEKQRPLPKSQYIDYGDGLDIIKPETQRTTGPILH